MQRCVNEAMIERKRKESSYYTIMQTFVVERAQTAAESVSY